ncbi:MAG: RluA family pseudouridine synthase [Desulfobacteraceae bacterium]|nr:RluA family pseudouridine synthase [Desulfobacteraceae bacterium]MBC2756050.1 RluA family pseudouridine synthase [Desulfobacteraceae bacterium]
MHDNSNGSFAIRVDNDDIGKRLDTFITTTFPEISRSTASRLIRNGDVTVSGAIKKPGYRVNGGDIVYGTICELPDVAFKPEPLDIDIDIIFEDSRLLVINKKPGIVVHPSPGHGNGTIANGLLYHRPQIEGVGVDPTRPGIVHRLDKDTSGIMVVAKTESAYKYLVSQFKERLISKKYLGIVFGIPDRESGQIILNIGRHASLRKKMTVTDHGKARYAETHWKIRERYDRLSLLEFDIKTGRTHQIRVHCAAIRHPIVGDLIYGFKKPYKVFDDMPLLKKIITSVPRQMLHAWQLRLRHPETNETLRFEAPLPDDMISFLENFKAN